MENVSGCLRYKSMRYSFGNVSLEQFGTLIVFLGKRLLGWSTQGFSKGPDGGRDAKFVGTAELHPSKAAPWAGTVIIQAKHTNGYNKHFSESDFYSSKSKITVIGEEIPRIKKLRKEKNLDHYMLFSNRRLGGNAESDIRSTISVECAIPAGSIYLCGLEQLESITSGREKGYIYTRDGNPNQEAFAQDVAALERAETGVVCATGMAPMSPPSPNRSSRDNPPAESRPPPRPTAIGRP